MKKVVFILFLMILCLLGVFAWDKKSSEDPRIEMVACEDMTLSCASSMFVVRFFDEPKAMRPLHLELTSLSREVKNIHASFSMKGMDMGFNRYRLIHVARDKWEAELTLPACVQGRSDWQMLIELELEKGTQRFLVPFSATNR